MGLDAGGTKAGTVEWFTLPGAENENNAAPGKVELEVPSRGTWRRILGAGDSVAVLEKCVSLCVKGASGLRGNGKVEITDAEGMLEHGRDEWLVACFNRIEQLIDHPKEEKKD